MRSVCKVREGIVQLAANFRGRKMPRSLHEAAVAMSKLRRDDPTIASVAGEVAAHQAFGNAVAVAFGRVDQIDALPLGLILRMASTSDCW